MKCMGQILTFLVILVLDQVTKYFASHSLTLGEPMSVLPGIFNLTLVYNPGAAFGMFGGYPDVMRRITLWGVSFIALFVVLRFMFNEARGDKLSQYALVGILAGALGNIIDRLRFDAVIDFLDFYWKTYHWPAFNVADSAICVGVAVLILRVTFARTVEHPPLPVAKSNEDTPGRSSLGVVI